MCKFCKGKHKAIIADLKVYEDRTVTVTSAIVNGNTLKFFATLQSGHFVGLIPLEAETKISYCPMCGRELVKE